MRWTFRFGLLVVLFTAPLVGKTHIETGLDAAVAPESTISPPEAASSGGSYVGLARRSVSVAAAPVQRPATYSGPRLRAAIAAAYNPPPLKPGPPIPGPATYGAATYGAATYGAATYGAAKDLAAKIGADKGNADNAEGKNTAANAIVPQQQILPDNCWAAAASMALTALGVSKASQNEIMDKTGVYSGIGSASPVANAMKGTEGVSATVYEARPSLEQMRDGLSKGTVNVYIPGHVVAAEWDKSGGQQDTVLITDPSGASQRRESIFQLQEETEKWISWRQKEGTA